MTLNEKAFQKSAEALERISIDYGRSNPGERLTYEQIAKAAIEAYEAALKEQE